MAKYVTVKRKFSFAALFILSCCAMSCQQPPKIDIVDGVTLAIAEHREQTISDIRYSLYFSIPDSLAQPITAREKIDFQLSNLTQPLILDFNEKPEKIKSIRISSIVTQCDFTNGHIVIPQEALQVGTNTISIELTAGESALNRGANFLYTLFVPDRAQDVFPCFDQPNLKAKFKLSLDIPEKWTAVANGELLSENSENGRKSFDFAETKLLPTYLFSFAAGEFEAISDERNGRELEIYHRETDLAKVNRNTKAIFDLHFKALDWLENYTGIPYPFSKFAFVLVPSFQYGGMEHPGAILYRANRLMLDESATQSDILGRASLIAHETAHIWFGDLVTMDWFNDVWMKEVFANFIAAKITNPAFPDINHDLRFLLAHYPAAYAVDRSAGANPIRQELDNLKDAGSLYGAIIYRKAPIVMRQLEGLVGEQAFREGLQEYLNAFAFGNGYGYFELDESSRRYLLENAHKLDNAVLRALSLLSLWEEMLNEKNSPDQFLSFVTALLKQESDTQIIQRALGYLGTVFWRFHTKESRLVLAPQHERQLWDAMKTAQPQNLKSAYFRAFRNIAVTQEGVDKLTRIWQNQLTIPGLAFAENDYTTLALELAVREVADWEKILKAQLQSIKNSDRKEMMLFVMPALSADQGVRDAFFESLKDIKNRRRESWVLTALRYLHHPLRARASEKYIRPSLDLVEEIQSTGDIFFPKRWLDATLGGHNSTKAAQIVREFLAEHPNYPHRLRGKILQSADMLFRAAKILHGWEGFDMNSIVNR